MPNSVDRRARVSRLLATVLLLTIIQTILSETKKEEEISSSSKKNFWLACSVIIVGLIDFELELYCWYILNRRTGTQDGQASLGLSMIFTLLQIVIHAASMPASQGENTNALLSLLASALGFSDTLLAGIKWGLILKDYDCDLTFPQDAPPADGGVSLSGQAISYYWRYYKYWVLKWFTRLTDGFGYLARQWNSIPYGSWPKNLPGKLGECAKYSLDPERFSCGNGLVSGVKSAVKIICYGFFDCLFLLLWLIGSFLYFLFIKIFISGIMFLVGIIVWTLLIILIGFFVFPLVMAAALIIIIFCAGGGVITGSAVLIIIKGSNMWFGIIPLTLNILIFGWIAYLSWDSITNNEWVNRNSSVLLNYCYFPLSLLLAVGVSALNDSHEELEIESQRNIVFAGAVLSSVMFVFEVATLFFIGKARSVLIDRSRENIMSLGQLNIITSFFIMVASWLCYVFFHKNFVTVFAIIADAFAVLLVLIKTFKKSVFQDLWHREQRKQQHSQLELASKITLRREDASSIHTALSNISNRGKNLNALLRVAETAISAEDDEWYPEEVLENLQTSGDLEEGDFQSALEVLEHGLSGSERGVAKIHKLLRTCHSRRPETGDIAAEEQ